MYQSFIPGVGVAKANELHESLGIVLITFRSYNTPTFFGVLLIAPKQVLTATCHFCLTSVKKKAL